MFSQLFTIFYFRKNAKNTKNALFSPFSTPCPQNAKIMVGPMTKSCTFWKLQNWWKSDPKKGKNRKKRLFSHKFHTTNLEAFLTLWYKRRFFRYFHKKAKSWKKLWKKWPKNPNFAKISQIWGSGPKSQNRPLDGAEKVCTIFALFYPFRKTPKKWPFLTIFDHFGQNDEKTAKKHPL